MSRREELLLNRVRKPESSLAILSKVVDFGVKEVRSKKVQVTLTPSEFEVLVDRLGRRQTVSDYIRNALLNGSHISKA